MSEGAKPLTPEYDCVHIYKVRPSYYDAIVSGRKTFEVRIDDRAGEHRPRPGCLLRLQECTQEGGLTGNVCDRLVAYRVDGGKFGLPDNIFVAGFDVVTAIEKLKATIEARDREIAKLTDERRKDREAMKRMSESIFRCIPGNDGFGWGDIFDACDAIDSRLNAKEGA